MKFVASKTQSGQWRIFHTEDPKSHGGRFYPPFSKGTSKKCAQHLEAFLNDHTVKTTATEVKIDDPSDPWAKVPALKIELLIVDGRKEPAL